MALREHTPMAMTLLVQLSDPHIRAKGSLAMGRVDTPTLFRRAVTSVLALRQQPAAVLISGDLADLAAADEYAHLAELIAPLPMPVYLMMGNHDDRDALRRGFPSHSYLREGGEFVQYTVPIGDAMLVALDTSEPRKPEGGLCEARLAWLEEALRRHRDRRTIVAMHHPPFRTYIGHMDGMGLMRGGPAFEAIIARNPQVERIVCGHLHRAIDVRYAGTIAATSPSTAHQVLLDLAPDAPALWTFEPPAFRVHAWADGEPMATHLAFSGPYEGPHPFDD
jgi:3',5'-cyclic AMP phosphodiesterase CpdA